MHTFKVTEIIDGDTFAVSPQWKWNGTSGDRVRPTGYDAPEKGTSSAHYNGTPCGPCHSPHYVHASLGGLLIGAARHNLEKRFTALSGHTHSEIRENILANLESRVAGAKRAPPESKEFFLSSATSRHTANLSILRCPSPTGLGYENKAQTTHTSSSSFWFFQNRKRSRFRIPGIRPRSARKG